VDIGKQIGKRIAELRQEKGFSQEELADLADIHEDYIGKIERGERTPSLKRLITINKAFGLKLEDFFRDTDI